MLPADTFACRFEHGFATCTASQPSAETAYRRLVVAVQASLGKLEGLGIKLPVQQITMGPTIGASMVIAVQGIVGLASLVLPLPASLAPLFEPGAQPAQLVVIVGTYADEVCDFIDAAMSQPEVFARAVEVAKTPPQQPIGAASQALGALFTKDRLIALGLGAAVVGSLIALARSSDRRLSGKVDRSGLFHDPNAPVDDGDDDDDHDAPEPEVIDAEAVEVIENEPAA